MPDLGADVIAEAVASAPLAAVRNGVIEPHAAFPVIGLPAPQGSKVSRTAPSGHTNTIEASKGVKPFREAVVAAALAHRGYDEITGTFPHAPRPFPLVGPIAASLVFTLPIPQGRVKARHLVWPDALRRNDLSKLTRACEDALDTAGLIEDDARIVEYVRLAKVYPDRDEEALTLPGVRVKLWSLVELIELPVRVPSSIL